MKHARKDYDERIQDSAGLIPDDEPVLLIRGQDMCALPAIDAWLRAAASYSVDPALIESIHHHRDQVAAWQQTRTLKVPDADRAVLK